MRPPQPGRVRSVLVRWAERLFPATGRHCATSPATTSGPLPRPRRRTGLPTHKSPYARDAAADEPFTDTVTGVRPYVLLTMRSAAA
ncbi:malate dehydrogenase [Streptomyces sp. NBRC 110611]|uniref:hypothetical protein n=1 Tax=Streptomyces sp. NBRC 110611 TaxID=1621259 RepID=UPI000856B6FE|nr:hypothetical protein [Streptomyces sp. NBRC 110611]GAU66890.1 malate dehydrogenase [Streptomyces sp. NBRC 110611]